jgi:hypothetical protein
VLLAAALGLLVVTAPRHDEYARIAIEHAAVEPEAYTTVHDANPDAFRKVVQDFGGTVKDMPGKLRYMRLCPYGASFAWHLVFETPDGLATLLPVPGSRAPAAQSASVSGWSAAVEPAKGGYYAIVTASAEATARFRELLRDRIAWNTQGS